MLRRAPAPTPPQAWQGPRRDHGSTHLEPLPSPTRHRMDQVVKLLRVLTIDRSPDPSNEFHSIRHGQGVNERQSCVGATSVPLSFQRCAHDTHGANAIETVGARPDPFIDRAWPAAKWRFGPSVAGYAAAMAVVSPARLRTPSMRTPNATDPASTHRPPDPTTRAGRPTSRSPHASRRNRPSLNVATRTASMSCATNRLDQRRIPPG